MAGASEVIALDPSTTGLDLEIDGNEILHLRLSEVRLDRVEIEGADWAVVRTPDGHNLMDRGLPSLPFLASEYLLDRTGGIELELVNVKLREIDLGVRGFDGVAPSKGHFDRTIDPDSVPWVFDDKVYQGSARFPAEDVWVDRPFIAGTLARPGAAIPPRPLASRHQHPDGGRRSMVPSGRQRPRPTTRGSGRIVR